VPRLLALGHVTFDRREGRDLVGGSVAYAALAARRLGWEAGVLTAAGPDFAPERDLAGVTVFVGGGAATTRFQNVYGDDGARSQFLQARAPDVELQPLPAEWRAPDALLLGPVAGELPGSWAPSFEAGVVGAIAQGWVREFDPADGRVGACAWRDPRQALFGVHVLFLSEQDLPEAAEQARELLGLVPMVALTRGWRGLTLMTRGGAWEVPALPRPEVDPTGAGDVFAAAFLVRYHECDDPLEAAAFAACAASCVVEGPGLTTLGDRAEVERRLVLRERLIEDGEWEE
jgi:sugar/nucleoside kinase (ribokinase family)